MIELVTARTDADDPGRVHWLDDAQWHSGDWAQLADALSGRPWLLLVDGHSTTLLEATLPVRDLSTARRAAPFAVEEQLAAPLDQTHISIAALGRNVYALAAIAAAELASLKQHIHDHKLEPRWIVPECCAVPWHEQSWSIVACDDWAIVRTGACSGLKTAFSNLAEIVPQLREQFPHTARVAIYTARDPGSFPLAVFTGLELDWHAPLTSPAIVETIARLPAPLLFDASDRAGELRLARRLWWWAAAAALVFLVAYPLLLAFGNANLERARDTLMQANHALVTAAFPTITRVVDARVQAEQAVAQLRNRHTTAPRFLDLLADFDRAFAPLSNAQTGVRSIAYSAGVLEIGVETTDMAALDRMRGALQTGGRAIDMLSAESTERGVMARLRLREVR